MENLNFFSVERIPVRNATAAFMEPQVFREDSEDSPIRIGNYQYMAWGKDNQMPFDVLDLIEKDETMTTCLQVNAEMLYGQGLRYNTENAPQFKEEIEGFFLDSDMQNYFYGCCMDLKYWGFCVTCFVLSKDGSKIVRVARKEAIYCRFAPIDKNGRIPYLTYGIWRKSAVNPDTLEKIPVIPPTRGALLDAVKNSNKRKFAIITRIPTVDSTYYPIPPYASLFRGNWYNIKQMIGIGKAAMLKHSAPIKYQVEIQREYWSRIFEERHITDIKEKEKAVKEEKQKIIDFLTEVENSGKIWFSMYYIHPQTGKEFSDVKITKIDTGKQGGDWESDIQEAINMICFAMRVHSNLVGSVPGKAQSNNSGSDKRELYTIAQRQQQAYKEQLLLVHRLIIRYNGYTGVFPEVPIIELTTLDEHKDSQVVTINNE